MLRGKLELLPCLYCRVIKGHAMPWSEAAFINTISIHPFAPKPPTSGLSYWLPVCQTHTCTRTHMHTFLPLLWLGWDYQWSQLFHLLVFAAAIKWLRIWHASRFSSLVTFGDGILLCSAQYDGLYVRAAGLACPTLPKWAFNMFGWILL